MNQENWLQHIDVTEKDGWIKVDDIDELTTVYNFPTVDETNFEQLYEVTSVHPLRKGVSSMSYSRTQEVYRNYPIIDTFEELVALMKDSLDDLEVYALRQSRKPAGYTQLEVKGVLPEWPGNAFNYVFLIKLS